MPPMDAGLMGAPSPGAVSSDGDADLFNADLPSVSSVGSLADQVVSKPRSRWGGVLYQ